MMLALALRFFPVLTEETDIVIKAQIARGAPLESGPPWQRLRAMGAILVPIFIRTFRHAQHMAIAMECRLYGARPTRTLLYPLIWKKSDSIIFIGMVFLLGTSYTLN